MNQTSNHVYQEISRCRICGNTTLLPVVDLGTLALTGYFPSEVSEEVARAPLDVVKCDEQANQHACGLVQLRHSCQREQLFSPTYGYRSRLNAMMQSHLNDIVQYVTNQVCLNKKDIVLDIGSNDGTLLNAYPPGVVRKLGIDPLGALFREYYSDDIDIVADYFSPEIFRKRYATQKAKIITSVALLYDIENPLML